MEHLFIEFAAFVYGISAIKAIDVLNFVIKKIGG